jgi:hypothetical protein
MTHTGWNQSGYEATSFDVRRAPSLLVLLILLSASKTAWAEKPSVPFRSPASAAQGDNDFRVEARVLRALRQDSQLRPLNLSVRMVRGIAHLSGPVPSAEFKRLAIRIAERVEGVLEVRGGELYITKSAQAPKPMLVRIEEDQPTQTRSASPHSLSSGDSASPQSNSAFPVSPQPIAAAQPAAAEPYRPPSPRQQITLLAPESVAPLPRQAEPARLTAHPRPSSPQVVSPAAALERLRRADTRFQYIRTQVQGATVSIFPGETSFEDVMRFAQAVRRLPGVQHVVVASGSR